MNNLTKLLSVLLFVSLLGFSGLALASQTKPDKKENQKENSQQQVNGVKPERVKPVKPERVKPVKPVKPERVVRVQNPSHYNGVITEVTDNTVTISLKKEPTTKTFTLDSKSQINKDLNKINQTDLKVGDIVDINLERIGKEDFRVRSVKVITAETQNIIEKIQIKTKDKEVKL